MKYLPNLSVSAKDLFNELFGEHNFSEISTTGKDEKISLYFFLIGSIIKLSSIRK